MKQVSTAPLTTTPTAEGHHKHPAGSKTPGGLFMAAALNMSWQLAIVVLVPFVGGFKLDNHFHSAPLWTIIGFVLALAGMSLVVWRQAQQLTPPSTGKGASS